MKFSTIFALATLAFSRRHRAPAVEAPQYYLDSPLPLFQDEESGLFYQQNEDGQYFQVELLDDAAFADYEQAAADREYQQQAYDEVFSSFKKLSLIPGLRSSL
jgi:hypothetical protein